MPALADHRAFAYQHRPDERIGGRRVAPVLCEFAGALHEPVSSHSFLSPIRTLTVGAGLRPCHLGLHRLNPRVTRARGLSRGLISPRIHRRCGNFTRPRKLPKEKLPYYDYTDKESVTLRFRYLSG